MANRRKLYFDFLFTSVPTTGKVLRLRATAGAANSAAGVVARNGDFLESLQALAGGSGSATSNNARRQLVNETQLNINQTQNSRNPGNLPSRGIRLEAYFSNASGATALAYLTVGGNVAAKLGHSSVFTRDFSVLLKAFAVGTSTALVNTVRGVLVAQREHSMDV